MKLHLHLFFFLVPLFLIISVKINLTEASSGDALFNTSPSISFDLKTIGSTPFSSIPTPEFESDQDQESSTIENPFFQDAIYNSLRPYRKRKNESLDDELIVKDKNIIFQSLIKEFTGTAAASDRFFEPIEKEKNLSESQIICEIYPGISNSKTSSNFSHSIDSSSYFGGSTYDYSTLPKGPREFDSEGKFSLKSNETSSFHSSNFSAFSNLRVPGPSKNLTTANSNVFQNDQHYCNDFPTDTRQSFLNSSEIEIHQNLKTGKAEYSIAYDCNFKIFNSNGFNESDNAINIQAQDLHESRVSNIAIGFEDINMDQQCYDKASFSEISPSPLSIGFTFTNKFLSNGAHSLSPPFGCPLTRMASQYSSPLPISPLPTLNTSKEHCLPKEVEMEYMPWISETMDQAFLTEEFIVEEIDFDLPPLRYESEGLQTCDPPESRDIFPENFLPFQDYGEFQYDKSRLAAAALAAKDFSKEITRKIEEKTAERLKTFSKDASQTRHFELLKYADEVGALNLIEAEWVQLIMAGGCIDFSKVSQFGWSVDRGVQFINALIPSILYDTHFEEILFDFLDEFFLVKVVNVTYGRIVSQVERNHLSLSISKAAKVMIAHLISPEIFELFISYLQPIFYFKSSNELFEALVAKMKTFSIPEPFEISKQTAPIQPKIADEKLTNVKSLVVKKKLLKFELNNYKNDLEKYENKLKNYKRKKRLQDELIRISLIHKSRSFDFLKILVTHLAEPIMKFDSEWIKLRILNVPAIEENQSLTKPKSNVDRLIMGPNSHENQDFFDALFFSRILRALLSLENPSTFIPSHIEPFLKYFSNESQNLSLRYLKAIDRFIKTTRFNVVSNVLPKIIGFRRYLIVYLAKTGAELMGIDPIKIPSRCISLGLVSLFESLFLYEALGEQSLQWRKDILNDLVQKNDIPLQFIFIYSAYNPVEYHIFEEIIESYVSSRRLNTYLEIFAMVNNVELLPIYQRKILKFDPIVKDPQQEIIPLQSHNSNSYEDKPILPQDYRAIYEWSMSQKLKGLTEIGTQMKYPYGNFASRILLARRFGISFDASNYLIQQKENFTRTEYISFINFYLEREAQFLINRAVKKRKIDSEQYQVYRVVDSQEHLHRMIQLPADEPTHPINMMIKIAFTNMPQSDKDEIFHYINLLVKPELDEMSESNKDMDKLLKKLSWKKIFEKVFKGMEQIPVHDILKISIENAVQMVKYYSLSPEET